jgi:hypothetical protein
MINIVLQLQVFGTGIVDNGECLRGAIDEEAGYVAGVDRLKNQTEAGGLQCRRSVTEVFDQGCAGFDGIGLNDTREAI